MLKRFPSEMDPFLPIVPELTRLMRSTESTSKLESIVDAADDIDDPVVIDALVELASNTLDDGVRLEIVRALRKHTSIAGVLVALQEIAAGPDGRARESAQRAVDAALEQLR